MRCLLTYLLFVGISWTANTQVLSAYKDGTWWLVNDKNVTRLPQSFTHVGNFDLRSKTAEFISESNYGVIDANGKVVLHAGFHNIESLGNGLYYCIDDSMGAIIDIDTKSTVVAKIQKHEELNSAYSLVQHQDSLRVILHLESKRKYNLCDSCRIVGADLNTLLVREEDTLWSIYNLEGDKITLKEGMFSYNFGYITYQESDGETLITAKFNRKFNKLGRISVSGNLVSYHDGNLAYLYDSEKKQLVCSGNYDKIQRAYFGGFFVQKNGLIGWMNEHEVVKIPINYDAISKFDENYLVRKGNLQGQYDRNYQLVVPVAFYDFYKRGDFLQTSSVLGYKGLYSLINKKKVLDNIHSRIEIENGVIKAYYQKNIRVLQIEDNHRILQDIILPNAITVKQVQFSPFDPDFSYDRRLLNLGWFYMKSDNLDSLGNIIGNKYRWGLKNGDDSILIAPKLVMPVYMDRQFFSLIKTGKGEYKSAINSDLTHDFYGMRNHSTGRAFGNELIIQMDSIDCMNRSYVRYETTKGYRILLPNDSIKKVTYVSSSYNTYLPYCEGGKPRFCEKSPISVRISHFSLNGRPYNSLSYQSFGTGAVIDHQEIEGGKWNYLDSNGADLFTEPFDFAQEFYHNRAIVLKGKNWGVISQDTIVIPCEFSEIIRLKQFDDTVFLVKKDHHGKYLLNSSLDIVDNVGSIVKSDGNISIVKNGKNQLVYRNDQLEKTHSSNTILLGNDYYAIQDKKTYTLINSKGQEVGQFDVKPKELLSDEVVLVSDHANVGLANTNGTILLEPGKFSLVRSGEFIHQISKTGTVIRNLEGKELVSFGADVTVFQDAFSSSLLVEKKGKIEQYNNLGIRQKKFKLQHLEPNSTVYAGLIFSRGYIQSMDTSLALGKEYSFELYSDGYFAIKDAQEQISVYQRSFENKVLQVNARKLKEVGKGIFSYYSSDGIVLVQEGVSKNLGFNAQIVSGFQDGFCLIKEGRDYYFLNEQFENPFNRKFVDAKPFQGEFAAIKVKSGWTIIDAQGKQKSFPSFNTINQKGKGLFESDKKSTYGLYDNNGNELLPAIYEKIECITEELIKVYKVGEIGYYKLNGQAIFDLEEDRFSHRK